MQQIQKMLMWLPINTIIDLVVFVALLVGTLISVAYYTLCERKVLAAMQRRKGPNRNGIYGLLQPASDGSKLITKEGPIPRMVLAMMFVVAPALSLILSFLGWSLLPIFYENPQTVGGDLDILLFLCLTAFSSYGVILAGWASFSRYATIGSLRAVAQFISYEIIFLICLFPSVMLVGGFNFYEFYTTQQHNIWLIFPTLPNALIFFIIMLAETNRTPFDLPESESELVSGYNVEYGSVLFAMFFLSEYNSMLMMSTLYVVLFLGAWNGSLAEFIDRVTTLAMLIITVRAMLPRYKYDQVMSLCWYVFLPLAVGFCVLSYGINSWNSVNCYSKAEISAALDRKYPTPVSAWPMVK